MAEVIRTEFVAELPDLCPACSLPLGVLVRVSYRTYAPTRTDPTERVVLGVIPLDEAACCDEDCEACWDKHPALAQAAQAACERWTSNAVFPKEWGDDD